jgi:2-amino-4-hydroxy-6-hydroxymethyldihydropteridine diphosphokinase
VARAYVGIGSNLLDPARQVRAAIDALRALGSVVAVSSLYRTTPWGTVRNQSDFINAAVALETQLDPHALLGALKTLECELGRDPAGERWGPRAIDLDILIYEGVEMAEPELTIPHPRLHERAFALVPLAEIAPQYAALRDALTQTERDAVALFLSS